MQVRGLHHSFRHATAILPNAILLAARLWESAPLTMANDTKSIFSYDGEGESDSFSVSLLTAAVTEYFQTPCQLVKLAQGGFHKVREFNLTHNIMLSLYKVYDVVRNDTVDVVVRVASPVFPKDKLESEVIIFRPPLTAQS